MNKRFDKRTIVEVLKNVTFSIQEGEFVCVIGPSGSGKSTLLYLLGALDKPSSGEIVIDQQNIAQMDEKQRSTLRQEKLGFVFQFHFLLPEFNALENVALPQLLKKVPEKEAYTKAKDLLTRVGLSHRFEHTPAQLSGGEQQRVAIARALVHQPRLVLADEPTGNLDTDNTRQIVSILKELNQERKQTIIVVTHDLSIAREADRVIYLVDGQIQDNLPTELVNFTI